MGFARLCRVWCHHANKPTPVCMRICMRGWDKTRSRDDGMAERNGKAERDGDKTRNGMAERNGDKTRNGMAERNGDKTRNGMGIKRGMGIKLTTI